MCKTESRLGYYQSVIAYPRTTTNISWKILVALTPIEGRRIEVRCLNGKSRLAPYDHGY